LAGSGRSLRWQQLTAARRPPAAGELAFDMAHPAVRIAVVQGLMLLVDNTHAQVRLLSMRPRQLGLQQQQGKGWLPGCSRAAAASRPSLDALRSLAAHRGWPAPPTPCPPAALQPVLKKALPQLAPLMHDPSPKVRNGSTRPTCQPTCLPQRASLAFGCLLLGHPANPLESTRWSQPAAGARVHGGAAAGHLLLQGAALLRRGAHGDAAGGGPPQRGPRQQRACACWPTHKLQLAWGTHCSVAHRTAPHCTALRRYRGSAATCAPGPQALPLRPRPPLAQVMSSDVAAVTHIVHHILVPSYLPNLEEGALRVAALLRASPRVRAHAHPSPPPQPARLPQALICWRGACRGGPGVCAAAPPLPQARCQPRSLVAAASPAAFALARPQALRLRLRSRPPSGRACARALPQVGSTFCQLLVSAYTGSTMFPEHGPARWAGCGSRNGPERPLSGEGWVDAQTTWRLGGFEAAALTREPPPPLHPSTPHPTTRRGRVAAPVQLPVEQLLALAVALKEHLLLSAGSWAAAEAGPAGKRQKGARRAAPAKAAGGARGPAVWQGLRTPACPLCAVC
jgi:hypothetical protein